MPNIPPIKPSTPQTLIKYPHNFIPDPFIMEKPTRYALGGYTYPQPIDRFSRFSRWDESRLDPGSSSKEQVDVVTSCGFEGLSLRTDDAEVKSAAGSHLHYSYAESASLDDESDKEIGPPNKNSYPYQKSVHSQSLLSENPPDLSKRSSSPQPETKRDVRKVRSSSSASTHSSSSLPPVTPKPEYNIVQADPLSSSLPKIEELVSEFAKSIKSSHFYTVIPPSGSYSFNENLIYHLSKKLDKPLAVFDIEMFKKSNKVDDFKSLTQDAKFKMLIRKIPHNSEGLTKKPYFFLKNMSSQDLQYLLILDKAELYEIFDKHKLIVQPQRHDLTQSRIDALIRRKEFIQPLRNWVDISWEERAKIAHFFQMPLIKISVTPEQRAIALYRSPLYETEILKNYKLHVPHERLAQFIAKLGKRSDGIEEDTVTDSHIVQKLSEFLRKLESKKSIKQKLAALIDNKQLYQYTSVKESQITNYFRLESNKNKSPYLVNTPGIPKLSRLKRSQEPLKKLAKEVIESLKAGEEKGSAQIFDDTILLEGAPGWGKTWGIQAMAKYIERATGKDCKLFKAAGSNFSGHYTGDGDKKVNAFFDEALDEAVRLSYTIGGAVIMFIDELDIIRGRQSSDLHGQEKEILGALMDRLDGAITNTQKRHMGPYPVKILFIGATNRMKDLDEAIIRRLKKKYSYQPKDGLKNRAMKRKALSLQLHLNAPKKPIRTKKVSDQQVPHKIKPQMILTPESSQIIRKAVSEKDPSAIRDLIEALETTASADSRSKTYKYELFNDPRFHEILSRIAISQQRRAQRVAEGRVEAEEKKKKIEENTKMRMAQQVLNNKGETFTPPGESQGSKYSKRKVGKVKYEAYYPVDHGEWRSTPKVNNRSVDPEKWASRLNANYIPKKKFLSDPDCKKWYSDLAYIEAKVTRTEELRKAPDKSTLSKTKSVVLPTPSHLFVQPHIVETVLEEQKRQEDGIPIEVQKMYW